MAYVGLEIRIPPTAIGGLKYIVLGHMDVFWVRPLSPVFHSVISLWFGQAIRYDHIWKLPHTTCSIMEWIQFYLKQNGWHCCCLYHFIYWPGLVFPKSAPILESNSPSGDWCLYDIWFDFYILHAVVYLAVFYLYIYVEDFMSNCLPARRCSASNHILSQFFLLLVYLFRVLLAWNSSLGCMQCISATGACLPLRV